MIELSFKGPECRRRSRQSDLRARSSVSTIGNRIAGELLGLQNSASALTRDRRQRLTYRLVGAAAKGDCVASSDGPVRIGNCSGFYGDRLAAMREMLTGGDLDYLTGDYLAELTMLILARDRAKSPDRGYDKTFLTQLEDCLGTALDRGVRIVANAGGLNPAGLAESVRGLAERLRPSAQ